MYRYARSRADRAMVRQLQTDLATCVCVCVMATDVGHNNNNKILQQQQQMSEHAHCIQLKGQLDSKLMTCA